MFISEQPLTSNNSILMYFLLICAHQRHMDMWYFQTVSSCQFLSRFLSLFFICIGFYFWLFSLVLIDNYVCSTLLNSPKLSFQLKRFCAIWFVIFFLCNIAYICYICFIYYFIQRSWCPWFPPLLGFTTNSVLLCEY